MRKFLTRFLCLTLCLLLGASSALAADYTLPEKMQRQVEFGSGVRGAVTLAVSGGEDWLDPLLPFTGSDLQLRYITVDGQFQGQLYAVDDQQRQRALTQVYGDDTHLYLRTDLLPDTVLYLPIGGDLMDILLRGDGQNPTLYSLAQQLFSISDTVWARDWEPALEPYTAALDLWLNDFAMEPSVLPAENGSSTLLIRHEIPAQALKDCMKDLAAMFSQDAALHALLEPLLSAEQIALYLNPTLLYYYDAVIDALPLEGTLHMERSMSTLGEAQSATLSLPLPENEYGWSGLTCELTPDETSVTLVGADQSITLVARETVSLTDNTTWRGVFRYLPAEGTPLSAAFSLNKKTSRYAEEDGRSHELTEWTFTADPDLSHLAEDDPARADYAEFEQIVMTLSTHYYSREQQRDPTNLEILFSAVMPTFTVDLGATLRTTNPWALSDLPRDDASAILELTPERIAGLLADFTQNAATTMTSLVTSGTPEPEPEQPVELPTAEPPESATDLPPVVAPADTEAPAELPTDAPAGDADTSANRVIE